MSHDLTQYQALGGQFDDQGYPDGSLTGMEGMPPAPPAWQRYLSVLLRRKWLILLVTVIGAGLGFVASRFVTPSYRADVRLWVQARGENPNAGPIRDPQLLQATGWVELLKASAVLEPVVKDLRLFVTPNKAADRPLFNTMEVSDNFRGRPLTLKVSEDGKQLTLLSGDEIVSVAAAGEPLGYEIGLSWVPPTEALTPGRKVDFYVSGIYEAVRGLGNRLIPSMAAGQNFLVLSMDGTDPEHIAAVLNAVSERFVTVAAELKRANLVQLTEILEEQLQFATNSLNQATSELESFRVATITLPSERAAPVAAGLSITRDPVFDNYFELGGRREQLRQWREGVERVLQEAETSTSALDGLLAFPAVPPGGALAQALTQRMAKRTELNALTQYTDQHPIKQQLIAEVNTLERQTIPTLARELIASLTSQEEEATRRIESASVELRQIPPRAMEEAGLQRNVAIAQDLHTELKNRYEVARLAAAGSVPDITILDHAVAPAYPVSDSRTTVMAMGLLGSFGLAVLVVLLLDRVDPKVRYPEQVTHGMGLPIIGMVPHLKVKTKLINGAQVSAASEAFREIRLSLLHAHGAAGPVFFTVSSAEPGDGKSFMVSNLAIAFSQQGYRTLIIDGDIRRGRLHAAVGGRRSPGLTDYLAGRVTELDIVQETEHPNVHLIGSGTRVQIGPELLGSPAMRALTKSMRSRYDVIIVDSPPLGAGVDPYVLGTISGNLLLVFRTGNTNRSFAQTKLSLIDRLPIRLLGAVLNDVPMGERLYQSYGYLPGYESSTERGVDWVTNLSTLQQPQAAGANEDEPSNDILGRLRPASVDAGTTERRIPTIEPGFRSVSSQG